MGEAAAELSVVIPVFNEAENIRPVLERFATKVSTPHEILIVHDFDEDTTVPVVREMIPRTPGLRLHRNDLGRGVLNAMKAGIAASRGQLVLISMADGSDELECVDPMVERARAGADLVAASRYMRGGRQIGGPRFKGFLSRAAGLSLHWFGRLPIHDPTNNFKLYRRTFLDSIVIESRGGFELALELSVKATVGGYRLAEVPTTWRDRTAGTSNFKLRAWLPMYLRWYLQVYRARAAELVRRDQPCHCRAVAWGRCATRAPSTAISGPTDMGWSPESVYDCRWSAGEMRAKDGVWREIARYLQRYVPADGAVLDIAADRGHFITNITAREKWASDLRDTSAHLPSEVRFVKSDGLQLDLAAPNGHFDVAFMSNYLEHLPSSDAVVAQMHVVRKLLKPTGRMIVLQPNIRHVGGEYWDFIDHHVPLTERSLVEAGSLAGFRTVALHSRFLPYSFRSRMPSHPLLVRAYLAFPPAWRFLGKQTLYVAEPA